MGADLRYAGQQNEVGIVFDRDPRQDHDVNTIGDAFAAAYFAQYGVNPSHVQVEVVSWRMTARGPETVVEGAKVRSGPAALPKTERFIALWPNARAAAVYDRASLAEGQVILGPALVEERETTIAIPPGWTGTVDQFGCITATRSA